MDQLDGLSHDLPGMAFIEMKPALEHQNFLAGPTAQGESAFMAVDGWKAQSGDLGEGNRIKRLQPSRYQAEPGAKHNGESRFRGPHFFFKNPKMLRNNHIGSKFEIRNPKFEIRNKFQIPKSEFEAKEGGPCENHKTAENAEGRGEEGLSAPFAFSAVKLGFPNPNSQTLAKIKNRRERRGTRRRRFIFAVCSLRSN
jgi:hypothetical protein